MRHRHVVVAAILLLLLMPLATMQQPALQRRYDRGPSGSPAPYTPEAHGEADTVAPVTHITASSWYDHGRQEAALLLEHYAPYVRALMYRHRATLDGCHDDAARHLMFLRERYPSMYERLHGIADGMDMPAVDVAAWCLRMPDVLLHPDACTATAVPGTETRDGEALLSWNLDLHYLFKTLFSRYLRPPPLVVCGMEGCHRYVQIGVFPFLFGFGLLNERRLCYAAAMVRVNDTGEGLTSLELNQLAMQRCGTVGEVAMLYRDAERESGTGSPATAGGMTSSLNTLWADGEGGALLLEYTHRFFAARFGLVAETNHHQLLEPRLTGAPVNDGSFSNTSSYVRLARAYELLRQHRGRIDAAFLRDTVCADHGAGVVAGRPDLWDICRHTLHTPGFPWDVLRFCYGTVCSLVVEPSRYVVHYCPGHPCMVPFRTIELADLLTSEP
jgi:hypothetical protein